MAIMEILSLHISCSYPVLSNSHKNPDVSLKIYDFCLRSLWGPFGPQLVNNVC